MQLISIILPTHNGAVTIAAAISSIQAQTYQQWELIVINDGSTDETSDIVKKYQVDDARITLIEHPHNLGIQKALNQGLLLARGSFIARIDDDDRWGDTEKLSQQVAFLELNPEYVLVGTGVIVVDEVAKNELLRYIPPQSDESIRRSILGKNFFVHSAVLFSKKSAQSVGGYD